jgi:hypothetical protein
MYIKKIFKIFRWVLYIILSMLSFFMIGCSSSAINLEKSKCTQKWYRF